MTGGALYQSFTLYCKENMRWVAKKLPCQYHHPIAEPQAAFQLWQHAQQELPLVLSQQLVLLLQMRALQANSSAPAMPSSSSVPPHPAVTFATLC